MSPFIIYALHSDSSNRVYVGKSTSGLQRPKRHGQPSNLVVNARFPVVRWIKKLRSVGIDYEVAVLEECTTAESLVEAERFHILYFRSLGMQLLNCSDGGEGLFNPSSEVRAKLSAAQKRIRSVPEARAKMSAWARGRKASPETRAKISMAVRQRPPMSESTRRKRQQVQMSSEARAKISAALRVRQISPATREKLSLASRARWKSPAMRENS